ncbi:hypothetical protein D3C72_707310 [compost metagenome]
MQLHDPVRLAQVAVGVVGVDHHEAGIELAAHGVVVGAADQVCAGGGELDHVLGLAHVIQADRGDQHAAAGSVEDGIEQHRPQGALAQLVEDLANPEAQERLVLQRLHRPLGNSLDERFDRFAGKGELKQARRLFRGGDGETTRFERQWHHKFVDLRKSVHGSVLAEKVSGAVRS